MQRVSREHIACMVPLHAGASGAAASAPPSRLTMLCAPSAVSGMYMILLAPEQQSATIVHAAAVASSGSSHPQLTEQAAQLLVLSVHVCLCCPTCHRLSLAGRVTSRVGPTQCSGGGQAVMRGTRRLSSARRLQSPRMCARCVFKTTVGSRSRLQLLCRWCCMQDGLIHGRGNRQRSSLSTAAAQLRAPTAGVCKGTQHWGVCGWLV